MATNSTASGVPSVTPFVKKEIPATAPVTFFGQKQLPVKEVDASASYAEYNVTMDRLEKGIAEEKDRREQALLAKD